MNFLVESDFTYNGFRCVVVGQDLGHRCGYVGIPDGHKLYGSDYNGLNFDVHGGLTFSGGGGSKYPVESNLWWLGFDCAHCDDAMDKDLILKLAPPQFVENRLRMCWGGTVRTQEYVESELRSLVDQIADGQEVTP